MFSNFIYYPFYIIFDIIFPKPFLIPKNVGVSPQPHLHFGVSPSKLCLIKVYCGLILCFLTL